MKQVKTEKTKMPDKKQHTAQETLNNAAVDNTAKKASHLSSNPNKAMQQMMVTIDELKARTIKETAALNESNTSLFMDLQDEKLTVAREYLHGMEDLMSRSDEMKNASPAIKEKFKEVRENFALIAKENLEAIEKMRNGMRKLEERIILAARKEADSKSKFSYGSNGYLQNGIASRIGVNESA